MGMFLFMLVLGAILLIASKFLVGENRLINAPLIIRPARIGLRVAAVVVMLVGMANTSMLWVPSGKSAHLHKVYGTKGLDSGDIIARNGETGPQAKILPPGFKFIPFITLFNKVEYLETIEIPEGSYGYVTAKDGLPLEAGEAFAEAFPGGEFAKMVEDAEYFFSNGGKRGPQTSVLPPGTYRFNHYLFDIKVEENTVIEAGHVGVITSRVHSAIDFGLALNAPKPTNVDPIDPPYAVEGQLKVPVVPVGAIGVWVQALTPGSYRINKNVYKVDVVDTRVQTWEYQGGWKKRTIDLKIDSKGEITQNERFEEKPRTTEAVHEAILLKVDSWEIPQEARVLVQVTPIQAPYTVASVGTLEDIENDVLTPTIMAVLRSAAGGGTITVEDEVIIRDEKGVETGRELKKRTRKIQPLDLIDNREKVEDLVEHQIMAEGMKANITIREIRLGETGIPPELLLPRMREQLANGLVNAYRQEQVAQTERINAEKAKATADKQGDLVRAEIEVANAKKLQEAREAEGIGEQKKLEAIAQGQRSQVEVLGQDRVVELRRYELLMDRVFKLLETPEGSNMVRSALENAHKFVPERVITVGGDGNGGGMAGFASIFGDFLSPSDKTVPVTAEGSKPAGK